MSRGISMNRRYEKHGWNHFNRPKHGNKLVMQQPIKRIASDPQCLKLVTSARASVVSCLNIIGRKVACFDIFSAGVHQRLPMLRARFVALSTLSQNGFLRALERRPPSAIMPKDQSRLVL